MSYHNRNMWLAIDGGWSGWIRTPNRGADMSPQGWGADGTLRNGNGYAMSSWGSHKRYTFEWPASSNRDDAQFMKSLADGTYGRGLVHFITPDIIRKNVLPAAVADPSMSVGAEGSSMIYGYEPEGVPTSGWKTNNLPITSAYYNLNGGVEAGYRGDDDSLFIPIPQGYSLAIAAFYTTTGTAGLYYSPVAEGWTLDAPVLVPQTENNTATPLLHLVSGTGREGVRLWIGRPDMTPSTITLSALYACLIPNWMTPETPAGSGYGDLPYGVGPYGGEVTGFRLIGGWSGGMGNSGCRFLGKPSYEVNGQVDGEYRVGYAASFVEVGSRT